VEGDDLHIFDYHYSLQAKFWPTVDAMWQLSIELMVGVSVQTTLLGRIWDILPQLCYIDAMWKLSIELMVGACVLTILLGRIWNKLHQLWYIITYYTILLHGRDLRVINKHLPCPGDRKESSNVGPWTDGLHTSQVKKKREISAPHHQR